MKKVMSFVKMGKRIH